MGLLPLVLSTVTATAATTATSSSATETPFIRGELIHIGTTELVSRFDHVGVRVGPGIISDETFLGVTPTAAFYPKPWAFSFHVPLNLLILEPGSLSFGGAKLRRKDWDEISDFARLIRFITYGRKEAPIYFTITSLRPTTLGHGQVIHNYQPNIDVDRSMTGVVLEGGNRWAGIQLQLNDITFRNNVVGALGYVHPLAFVDILPLKTLSLGVEYAADFRAPRCILISESDRRCVPGSNNRADPDPLTGLNRDDTFIQLDGDSDRPLIETTDVQILGFSGETKIVKTKLTDFKIRGTWHKFINGGTGIAAGLLGRFNTEGPWISAFRTQTEFRSFTSRFLPAYFDTLYEITKFQSLQSNPTHQVSPTRYQRVFGDPQNGFPLTNPDQRRFGYNVELSWALLHRERKNKKIALGIGLTDSTGPDDTNFYAHLELPLFKYVQLFASFLRVNAESPAKIFEATTDNMVVLSGLRAQLLPFLFINGRYQRLYQITCRGECHIGNSNVVDADGNTSPFFRSERIYNNVQTVFVDVEIGWEFKD